MGIRALSEITGSEIFHDDNKIKVGDVVYRVPFDIVYKLPESKPFNFIELADQVIGKTADYYGWKESNSDDKFSINGKIPPEEIEFSSKKIPNPAYSIIYRIAVINILADYYHWEKVSDGIHS